MEHDPRRPGAAAGPPAGGAAADLARRSGVVRAAASGYAAQGLAVAAAFFLTPLVLHHVGRTHFGLWVLVGAVVSYGSLLDLGISSAVVRYVAAYRASGRSDEARVVVATALWVYGVLGLVVIVVALALAPLVPTIFNVAAADRDLAVALTVLAGIGVGLGIPFTTPRAVLRGAQRFDLANAVAIAATVLTAAGTVAMVLLDRGILAIVAVSVAVTIVMQPVSVWLVRRAVPDVGYGWRGARRDAVGTIVGFSSSVWVMQIAGQLLGRSPAVIIGLTLPLSSVTPYALAQRLSQLAYISIGELPKLLMPLSTEVHVRRDEQTLRSVFLASTRITLAVGAAAATLVAVLGAELLTVWVGDAYAEYAPLVVLLALAVVADAVSLPSANILLGMGRHRALAGIAIAAGVVNVALALALVGRYELVGVAVAALATRAAGSLLVQLPYAAAAVGVGLADVARTAIVRVAAPVVALVAVVEVLTRVLHPASVVALVLVGGAGLAVFAAVYVVTGASAGERAFYRGYASRALHARSRAASTD